MKGSYLGPEFNSKDILKVVQKYDAKFEHYEDFNSLIKKVTILLDEGKVVGWFQGRMEYGPRSLGNRSIIALPNSKRIRDLLNLRLKMRVWYQPFCPTMLEEDAQFYLEGYDKKWKLRSSDHKESFV